MRRPAACVFAASVIAAASLAPGALAADAHEAGAGSAPVIKAFVYKPLTTKEEAGFLQSEFTFTVKLSKPTRSLYLMVVGKTNGTDEELLAPKSYGKGTHRIRIESTTLPGGTYKVSLFERVAPARVGEGFSTLKCTNPVTLVVAEASEGVAGAGVVKKL